MSHVFELQGVTKRYGSTVALDAVTLAVPRRSIVGLVGRNGSGKTTLLNHVTGLVLPDDGACLTLGRPAAQLGRAELSRIGAAHQHDRLIEWMTGDQLLRYVSSFYDTWDRELERGLVAALEVDVHARVGALSPGNLQKLSVIVAACHRPELLLLDEPLSGLDPIARRALLGVLLDRFASDDMTIVISSHMLRDIEPVIDRLVCLERGRVVADSPLDELKERYTEWIVTAPVGGLPPSYAESYVITARGDARRARLVVDAKRADLASFEAVHGATVEARPLNLERLFALFVEQGALSGGAAPRAHDAAGSTA